MSEEKKYGLDTYVADEETEDMVLPPPPALNRQHGFYKIDPRALPVDVEEKESYAISSSMRFGKRRSPKRKSPKRKSPRRSPKRVRGSPSRQKSPKRKSPKRKSPKRK